MASQTKSYVLGAKIPTGVLRTAPSGAGGRTFRFDLFDEFFGDLGSYGISDT